MTPDDIAAIKALAQRFANSTILGDHETAINGATICDLCDAADVLRELVECATEADGEYDGQMYTQCTACGANDLVGPMEHERDCLWVRARAIVGDKG